VYIAVIICLGLIGCGKDNGQAPQVTASMLTADGWTDFEAGLIEEAMADFEQALAKDAAYGEAYNGIAWCYLRTDLLEQALANFDEAIATGVTHADPHAGKAIIYRDLEPVDFNLAIEWASEALFIDPGYVFEHDNTLDWHDLRLILAHCFIALKDYGKAKVQVDFLNAANTLDPQSATFVDDLIAEVERLGTIY
jgi:tetratricopeptide (TPR) repeat protein